MELEHFENLARLAGSRGKVLDAFFPEEHGEFWLDVKRELLSIHVNPSITDSFAVMFWLKGVELPDTLHGARMSSLCRMVLKRWIKDL